MKNRLYLTLIFFLSIFSISFGQMVEDANVIASDRGGFVATVKGSSMEPMFHNSDCLIVVPMTADKLKVGMVCVYENNLGELVAHSVVSVNPLRLKGMANKVIDTDQVTSVRGVMYGIVHNIFNEKASAKTTVLAKKY